MAATAWSPTAADTADTTLTAAPRHSGAVQSRTPDRDAAMLQAHVPAWFEIPAHNIERAAAFYETLLSTRLQREQMLSTKLAVFPYEKPGSSGALIETQQVQPSPNGTVVYLNVEDIRPVLERLERAGGTLLQPLTELPGGMGVFAQIKDIEGNRVGLYSAR